MIAVFTGMPSVIELLIVAAIVLLLFGKRLPALMRSLGSSVVEFKKGVGEADQFESDETSDRQHPDEK